MSDIATLIEMVTADVVACLVEDRNIATAVAIELFSKSRIFEKLNERKTGLYRESGGYVYSLLQEELSADGSVQRKSNV